MKYLVLSLILICSLGAKANLLPSITQLEFPELADPQTARHSLTESKTPYSFKATLTIHEKGTWLWQWDDHFIQEMTLKILKDGQTISSQKTGYYHSQGQPHPFPEVSFDQLEPGVYQLEGTLQSRSPLSLHSNLVPLSQRRDLPQKSLIIIALYFGICISIIFFHLLFYFYSKDISYFWYSSLILSISAQFPLLNGWVETTHFLPSQFYLIEYVPEWAFIPQIIGVLFARSFFKTSSLPGFPKLLSRWYPLLLVTVLILRLLFQIPEVVLDLFSLATTFIVISLATSSYRAGFKPALWYLLGWILFLPFAFFWSLGKAGFIERTWLTTNLIMPGSLIEAFFMSVGLASRLRLVSKAEETLRWVQNRAQLYTQTQIQALSQMAGGLAHEINNPLAIISGAAAQITRQIEELPPRNIPVARESLFKIQRGLLRISEVLGLLRNFAADATSEIFEPHSISQLVQSVIESQKTKMPSELVFDLQIQNSSICFIQKARLKEAILSVIKNSVESVKEQKTPFVRIRISNDSLNVFIHISDSGPGVPPGLQDKIFEPFFTTHENPKTKGMGLSSAQGIIRFHQGQLELDSQSKSCFIITLPLYQPT